MAQENYSKDIENRFWLLTTRWWFFPLFYVLVSILISIIDAIRAPKPEYYEGWSEVRVFKGFVLRLLLLPGSVVNYYFIAKDLLSEKPLDPSLIGIGVALILDLVMILLMIYIPYCKIRKNIISKKLIVTLLSAILLSFIGAVLVKIFPIDVRGW